MPGVGCLNGRPLIADVTKTVLPATTGDDQPRPGTSIAHLTLAVFDQRSGNFASIARPSMCGPRNPGHSASGATTAVVATINAAFTARRAIEDTCTLAAYQGLVAEASSQSKLRLLFIGDICAARSASRTVRASFSHRCR